MSKVLMVSILGLLMGGQRVAAAQGKYRVYDAVRVGENVNDVRIIPWQLDKIKDRPNYDYPAITPEDRKIAMSIGNVLIGRKVDDKYKLLVSSLRIYNYRSQSERIFASVEAAENFYLTCKSFKIDPLGDDKMLGGNHVEIGRRFILITFVCPRKDGGTYPAFIGVPILKGTVSAIYTGIPASVYEKISD